LWPHHKRGDVSIGQASQYSYKKERYYFSEIKLVGLMDESFVGFDLPEPFDDEKGPYGLLVVMRAKPGMADALEARMMKNVEPTRREPGNITYNLNRDRANRDEFYFYEAFRDIDAYRDHQKTPYITDLLETLPNYVVAPPTVIFFTVSTSFE
jgi:quinol monooxygenase YgiN